MNIVYLGSGQLGINSLNALHSSDHCLKLVVTQPAHPAGRGKKQRPTPTAVWAREKSVELLESENVNSPETMQKIARAEADLLVVIAFGQKLGSELISLPPFGSINVHTSLLPKYRGAAPVNWAVINGEEKTGISIITLAEKMDAGDILAQSATPIGPRESAGQLHDRLAELAVPLLMKTIDQIAAGTAVYRPQDHSKATLAPKLKKSDGFLDFNEPAEKLERKIRGFWPWPEASSYYLSRGTGKCSRLIIAEARVAKKTSSQPLPPGTVDKDLHIQCGTDTLAVTKIKPAGGKLMDFMDFAHGRHTAAGDQFVGIKPQQ